jgi:hypothetical protein
LDPEQRKALGTPGARVPPPNKRHRQTLKIHLETMVVRVVLLPLLKRVRREISKAVALKVLEVPEAEHPQEERIRRRKKIRKTTRKRLLGEQQLPVQLRRRKKIHSRMIIRLPNVKHQNLYTLILRPRPEAYSVCL